MTGAELIPTQLLKRKPVAVQINTSSAMSLGECRMISFDKF